MKKILKVSKKLLLPAAALTSAVLKKVSLSNHLPIPKPRFKMKK